MPIPTGAKALKCNVCGHLEGLLGFYFVWYPGCPGPEPAENPVFKCPECSSKDLEEVDG